MAGWLTESTLWLTESTFPVENRPRLTESTPGGTLPPARLGDTVRRLAPWGATGTLGSGGSRAQPVPADRVHTVAAGWWEYGKHTKGKPLTDP
jgi:hypothetical protein